MEKIDQSNENKRRKPKRQRKLLSTLISGGVRHSYKKKILDDQQRKVWIAFRDMAGTSQPNNGQGKTGCSQILPKPHSDSHLDHWSLQTVTSKVLKVIRDAEFYNGCVYGYNQDRARKLLLEKGWIVDNDFAQPQLPLGDSGK